MIFQFLRAKQRKTLTKGNYLKDNYGYETMQVSLTHLDLSIMHL